VMDVAPMKEFVVEAVRQGFTSYGISSHAPLPFLPDGLWKGRCSALYG
jgi:histidinol-phosphate phosphatase (EC 3.1.3.15)